MLSEGGTWPTEILNEGSDGERSELRLCAEVGKKMQFIFHSVVFLHLVEEAKFTF